MNYCVTIWCVANSVIIFMINFLRIVDYLQLKVVAETFVVPMGKVTDVDDWTVRSPPPLPLSSFPPFFALSRSHIPIATRERDS